MRIHTRFNGDGGHIVANTAPGCWGPMLRNAALLEKNLAVLWIHLAITEGRGRFIGFKLLERG